MSLNSIGPRTLTPPDLQALLETAQIWIGYYQEIDLSTVLVREWKEDEDDRDAIEIIKALPDHLKPQLPEGFIWFKDGDDLKILGHQAAKSPKFKIYLFGPDNGPQKNSRIQYLVADRDVPIHGYAMTKAEGFSKDLRDKYPDVPDAFKLGTITYWRGHIIDYMETLGHPDQGNISTLFRLNYKPEPEGAWANILRKELVAKQRESGGSYSELILYPFVPKRTKGNFEVPAAVFIETFNYRKEHEHSYYVPEDHPGHGLVKKEREKNFAQNALRQLEDSNTFPPLIFTNGGNRSQVLDREDLSSQIDTVFDPLKAFKMKRVAEMEFERSTHQLIFALYSRVHGAPVQQVEHWLSRATNNALLVDAAYSSRKMAFPPALMNSVLVVLTKEYLDSHPKMNEMVGYLQKVTERLLEAKSQPGPALELIAKVKREEESHASLSDDREKISTINLQDVPQVSVGPEVVEATTISCLGIGPNSKDKIEDLMRRVTVAIAKGSPIILSSLTTQLANKIFQEIKKVATTRSENYQPLGKVIVRSPSYLKKVSNAVETQFGKKVPVENP